MIRDTWPFVRFVRDSGKYQVDTRTAGGGGHRKLYDTQEQALEAARIASEQKREFGTASSRNNERGAAGYSVRGQGGEGWQSDVLRHSFASYWLAIHKKRTELAEHMGNSTKIIGKHYWRVIAQTEAQAWFAILPPVDAAAKMLRMG